MLVCGDRLGKRGVASLVFCLLVGTGTGAARAQSEGPDTLRATLRGWADRAHLAILDRGGALSGRLSDGGILQRFNDRIEVEHDLDLLSSRFSLSEEYEWHRRGNGARYWAGSVNHLNMVHGADVAASVPLGERWGVDLTYTHQETLRHDRSLVRIGVEHRMLDGRARAFLMGTLKQEKPESDLELGFGWSPEPGRGELTVAVGALDLFSDLIYGTLGVDPVFADTSLDYTSHPFTLRVAADWRPASGVRLEAFGLVLTPTRVVAALQRNPEDGFTQDERYAYGGGLLEWTPDANTTVGVLGSVVRARSDREPLARGRPADAFDLTELTRRVAAYGLARLSSQFRVEVLLGPEWRRQERARPDTTVAPAVDYEDRAWLGRASLIHGGHRGPHLALGLDFVARDVLRDGPIPILESQGRHNFRIRLDAGWQFGRRAFLLLGTNLDLDGDTQLGARRHFDGGHGRLVIYW